MRSKAKKLLITTEKHEVFVMHLGAVESVHGLCGACGGEVEMLTLDSAIKVSGINGHLLIDRIANRHIHAIETTNGHLLICKRSLGELKN